ncbi:hypothetical protein ISCGN_001279 [Ixodes scapularis]
MAAAQQLVAQGFLSLGNVEVPLEPVGAHVVFVSVYRLPPYVSEEALVQVLAQYGKVKAIKPVTFRDRPDVRTGTRVVKMETSKPVPNFVHIQGHRVMVDYRGLRRVCSRCGLEGHIGPACKTPRCDRCGVFGHATAGCTAPCQRCGHGHATTDCVQRKSYAAAAKQPREDRPRTSQRVVDTVSEPAPQLSGDDSNPSIRPRTPPPPPVVSDSDALSNAGVSDSQASGAPSNAAAPTDGQTSDIPWNADANPGSQASRVSSNAASSQASRVPSNVATKPDCQTSDASSNAAAILESHSIDSEDLSDDSDHLFIVEVLRAFRFPETFISLLQSLYSGLTGHLQVNGCLLPPFPVSRGVRQGCPLSPLLYVLSLDPLLRRLASCSRICGFPLPGRDSVVVSAYADDVSLFVRNSDSFEAAGQLFLEYGALSGAC